MKKTLLFLAFVLCLSLSGQDKKITFAVLSDTHLGSFDYAIKDLNEAIADINQNPDIDLVIVSGDITEFGTDSEIMGTKNVLSTLSKKYLFVPGNHDTNWSESGCTTFNKVMGGSQFKYSLNGVIFIGISSGPFMRMGPCQAPREDIEWLEKNLKDIPNDTPIVFVCHSPLTLDAIANADQIIDLLKTKNIQFVISGHYHQNKVTAYEGIPAAICRSSLRRKDPCGGYTIATMEKGKMTLRERRPCEDSIRQPWGSVALKKYDPALDTIHPARQDYTADNSKTSRATLLWNIQDHSDIASGAIQEGKTVFFTNTVGELRAVSATDGASLWTFATGDKIFSEPTYANGKIYITSADGSIYCINAKNGKKIWQYTTDYPVLSTALVVGNVVYIGGGKGRFYALDAKKGSLIWAHAGIKGYMESRPTVCGNVVAIGSWASEFNAMDIKTGQSVWKHAPGLSRYFSPGACWATSYQNRIYVQSSDKKLYCYDAPTGNILWATEEPNGRESLGSEPDGSVLYVKSTKDYVIAIDASSPQYKELWRSNVGFGAEYGPTRITTNDKYAFACTGNGKVYCLDKKTGAVMWYHRFSSSLITSAFPVGQNALIVTTMGGGVFYMQIPQ